MKAYSQDLRDRVIKAYSEDGLKPAKIAESFRICLDTVYDWISRFKKTGSYNSQQGVGCGRRFRFTDKEAILDFIKSNHDADGMHSD